MQILLYFTPLPIRTDRSLRAIPYATYALLFTNILVYLSTLNYSLGAVATYQQRWGLTFAHPSLITLFTHGFIHANLDHLLGNLLVLWIVGTVLEAGIGSVLFMLLYLASLVGAAMLDGIVTLLFQPHSMAIPLIGASGAIAGITGYAAFRYYHIRVLNFVLITNLSPVPIPFPLPFWIPFWAYAAYFGGRELLFGITKIMAGSMGGVAHWAHLGGMLLGWGTAMMLRSYQDGQRESAIEMSAKAAHGSEPPSTRSVEELQRQLSLHPDDPELLEAMGGIALVQGGTEESHALYLKAIPQFLRMGRTDRAAVCYVNLLQSQPTIVFPLREQLALASALEALGHYTDAAKAFSLLVEHYPRSGEAETALLRAAQLHARYLHDRAEAVRLLGVLLRQYPDSSWCMLARERLRQFEAPAPNA